MAANTAPVTLTDTQVDLLRLVNSDLVTYTLGSSVRGMDKASACRRLDTNVKITSAMKRLRDLGLVSPTGARRGMSTTVVLTLSGRRALGLPETSN